VIALETLAPRRQEGHRMLSVGLRGATAAAHPLWMCGFRSFFLAAVLAAPLLIGCWVAFLALGLPLPAVARRRLVWHAHELLFGFAFAAVAGFALTSIPEFTRSAAFDRRPGTRAGRLCGCSAGSASGAAALFGTFRHCCSRRWRISRCSAAGLAAGAAPVARSGTQAPGLPLGAGRAGRLRWRLLRRGHCRRTSRALAACDGGRTDDADHRRHEPHLDAHRQWRDRGSRRCDAEYRARPPRRNLAIFCIGLYTATSSSPPARGSPAGWRWPPPPRCATCSTTGTSAAPCCAAGR
jgi:uncharacterized protein involved in response to NO